MRTLLCLSLLSLPAVAGAQARCESPGVLVVLDRSVSMRGDIDGASKWDIARDAIGSMLMGHGDAAHFGLMLYPGPSGNGAAGVEGPVGACNFNRVDQGCSPDRPRCSTGEVVVDVGPNTRGPILDRLGPIDDLSHSYTPTWQSLEAANRYPGLQVPNRRGFAVLLTDGWQCCGLFENADGSLGCEPEDRGLVVEKVAQLAESDIPTFVIGFGDLVDVDTLQNAAVAGGTAREGCDPNVRGVGGDAHCYYQARNHDALDGVLEDIVRRIGEELCDGQDNDCDGAIDEGLTRACDSACGPGEEVCFNGAWGQCDVPDARPESCNGRDDDCDGETDEQLRRECNNACGAGEEVCRDGDWNDCDAPPVGEEVCDGEDNNCDGAVDPGCECGPGETRECGDDVGACRAGRQRCEDDGRWGDCLGGVSAEPEVCDGVDNDCDGTTDGFERDCQTACGGGRERCEAGDWVGCDAPEPLVEACDGVDDDCDGRVDEDLSRECQTACGNGTEVCELGNWEGCTAREPGDEACDNGRDDDCDGSTDEGCGCADGAMQDCGTDDGVCTAGQQTCRGGEWGACEGEVTGGAEVCNGEDDDCDGVIDEGELCGDDQICACGGCADPCENFECPNESQCIHGHCVEDHCPDGLVCDEGNCVPGEGGTGGTDAGTLRFDAGPEAGAGSAGGSDCECRGAPAGGSGGWAWLALLGVLRRREPK